MEVRGACAQRRKSLSRRRVQKINKLCCILYDNIFIIL
jgi:hypothetical protein